jgi:hypothetical protein
LRRGCGHGNVCIVIVIIRAVVGRHCSGRGEKKEDRRKEKKVKRRGKKAPPQPLKLNVEVWPVLTLEALVTLVQTQNSGCLRKGRKREGQGVFWPVKLNTSLPFLIGRFFSYTKRRLLCIYEAYSALCMYVCMYVGCSCRRERLYRSQGHVKYHRWRLMPMRLRLVLCKENKGGGE